LSQARNFSASDMDSSFIGETSGGRSRHLV